MAQGSRIGHRFSPSQDPSYTASTAQESGTRSREVRTLRAVRSVGGKIEVVEVPAPSGDGVRVRVRSAGICGSDLHLIEAGFAQATLGHEIAGELDDGRPVVVEPITPCGRCAECVRGDYNLCRNGSEMVLGVAQDGGMADELRVPARSIVPLPTGIPVTDACLIEPLAVAVHGLRRARLRGGMRVAVVGGGAIGLCALAAARRAASSLALVARHDAQREAGERLGASEAEGEYDLVVEAAGSASAMARAVELCRPGGRIAMVATYWGGLEVPGFPVCMKEIDLIPASMYGQQGATRDIEVATALLANDPEIATTLITHRFPLDAAAEAFTTAAARSTGALKVTLEP